MVVLCRYLPLVLLLWFGAGRGYGAATQVSNETRAFNAAAEAFRGAFYDRAEAGFADFIQKFPASPRVPEACLFQAQARMQLGNNDGAIELLSARLASAGASTDFYLFWLGEANFRKGDFRAASDFYARLIKEFPASSRALEAVVGEAAARFKISELDRVLELLRQTNGVFQATASTNVNAPLVARGLLLLGEALLAQKNYPAAEQAVQPLSDAAIEPTLAWQKHYLLCQVALAQGKADEAYQGTTNLAPLAAKSAQPAILAQTAAFQGALLERLGRFDEAVAAYQRNLADGIPAESQRQALIKITEISIARNQIAQAAETLERFRAQQPGNAAMDLVLLTLGELRLRQFLPNYTPSSVAQSATNAVGGTNLLDQARTTLSDLVQKFPKSPLLGRAELNLGWCHWLEGKLPESAAAFRAAIDRLPPSLDQATAYLKLADAQFQQKDFTNALANYQAVTEKLSSLEEVRTNLMERALYQVVRAGIDAGDLASMTNALARVLQFFPRGQFADRALLLGGVEIGRRGDPAPARALFLNFLQNVPEAPLRSELDLAISRTYELETNWAAAIDQYDRWLTVYTNHESRARAEYYRAWASFQDRRETNAFKLFTNFVVQFPKNELTPLAQWWIADYYFRSGDPAEAEKNYLHIFQNTNWPVARVTYEARMMAGRAAVARQGWSDAIRYFTNLTSDATCPLDLRLQAMFAYGDCLLSLDSPETNKLANLQAALGLYTAICEQYPTNRLAPLAWGQRANCLLQWASRSGDYASVSNAFRQVVESAQAGPQARSIAKVGIGISLKAAALQKPEPERVALLKLALANFLDVFFGDVSVLREGEKGDVFWTRKAGLEAAEVAESLQLWEQTINIYKRLQELLPSLRARYEKNILKAQEQLAKPNS